jgi:signal transduction histidine kinase/ActR/RegA family two-component response regulator
MKLRTQTLAVLLLFGLVPLGAMLVITVPLIIDSLELFYHRAHLQNLRADFRDLDQHIASRMEMVRLLAKLPEGEVLVSHRGRVEGTPVAAVAERYADAINRILYDQHDIVQVLLLDRQGKPRFGLERDAQTLGLVPRTQTLDLPQPSFVEAGTRLEPGGVLISPISVNPEAGAVDPRRFMLLRLVSPLIGGRVAGLPAGNVVINLDIGGLAEAYPKTYWVLSDGSFLRYGGTTGAQGLAFREFPGLEDVFRRAELALWRGPENQHVIWVPILATETSGPLWVGRQVDASPLASFRDAVELRVTLVVLVLMAAVLLVARWFAGRAARFGRELADGIGQVLKEDKPARFAWGGPEELRLLADDLNRLAESQLTKSQALRQHALDLEESSRYKSEFLANVSHELRTPLNSILLLSKLLAASSEESLSPEQARQAQVIHEAGQDLAALIDNILDLARIEARKAPLTLAQADLPQLLEGLASLIRPQTDARGLALQVQVEPDAPMELVSDVDKVRQILKNFLANAVKFTERGQIRLVLGRSHEPDAETLPVRLSVVDTGIGIPADMHQVVFEAFKQADGSTSRRYGGSGLGLAISRGLAEILGGRIVLESEEGKGSTFSLLLPLELEPGSREVELASPRSAPAQPVPEAPLPSADFHGQRVLLVDDDVRDLLALTPVLERWGLHVLAAGDGREALETLQDEDPVDLVLIDLMLPGLTGDDTIRMLRGESRLRSVPVVAITARTEAEVRQASLDAGADDVLCKPIDPGALRDALARFLAPRATQPMFAIPGP